MWFLRGCLTLMLMGGIALSTSGPAQPAVDSLGDPLPEGALQRLGTLQLRYDSIGDLAYLPDGRAMIATGGVVQIWNPQAKELLFNESVIRHRIVCMHVRDDGQVVLLADSQGNVHEWDVENNEILRSFPTGQSALRSAYYSPDKKRVLTTSEIPPTLKEFDLATAEELVVIEGEMHSFNQGIYDAEGKTAFVGGPAGSDEVLAHYDLATGELLHKWHKNYTSYGRSPQLSPDGERVLVGSRTMAFEYTIDGYEPLNRFTGHDGHAVPSIAYCHELEQILTGSRDGSIRRWNRLTNEVLLRWVPHASHVTRIIVSGDGRRTLSFGGGLVVESEITTGAPTAEWERHTQSVNAVVMMPDGRRAVSGSSDGTLRLWDIISGESLATIIGAEAHALAVAPDGSRVAAGCKDGVVREFSLPEGALIRELTGHLGYIRSVVYTPDGRLLLSGADDGVLRIWNRERDEALHAVREHRRALLAIAVSADGRRALTGGRDATVRLWDLPAARLLHTFEGHRHWVEVVRFAAEGDYAFSAGGDGRILKWNLAGGKIESEMVQGGWVRVLVPTPDGKTLCAGGPDNLITCWDLETGEQTATLRGHQGVVWGLAVGADGRHLVSASADTTLLVWTLPAVE
jgi:WD40 repeat protein